MVKASSATTSFTTVTWLSCTRREVHVFLVMS
jgi:hypothetical protein